MSTPPRSPLRAGGLRPAESSHDPQSNARRPAYALGKCGLPGRGRGLGHSCGRGRGRTCSAAAPACSAPAGAWCAAAGRGPDSDWRRSPAARAGARRQRSSCRALSPACRCRAPSPAGWAQRRARPRWPPAVAPHRPPQALGTLRRHPNQKVIPRRTDSGAPGAGPLPQAPLPVRKRQDVGATGQAPLHGTHS